EELHPNVLDSAVRHAGEQQDVSVAERPTRRVKDSSRTPPGPPAPPPARLRLGGGGGSRPEGEGGYGLDGGEAAGLGAGSFTLDLARRPPVVPGAACGAGGALLSADSSRLSRADADGAR